MPGTVVSRAFRAVRRPFVIGLSVSLVAGGCSLPGRKNKSGPGSSSTSIAATTTISPLEVTLPTRPSPSASTPAPNATPNDSVTVAVSAPVRKRRGLNTPQAASRNLWDAWRDDDRRRALLYADGVAVRALFERRWTPDLVDDGCVIVGLANPDVSGSLDEFVCTYKYLIGEISLAAAGDTDRGYRVTAADRAERATTTEAIPVPTTESHDTTTTTSARTRPKGPTTTFKSSGPVE